MVSIVSEETHPVADIVCSAQSLGKPPGFWISSKRTETYNDRMRVLATGTHWFTLLYKSLVVKQHAAFVNT